MTDKQIINRVDVSRCEDYGYRGKAGYWCHNYDEPCTDYPNCIYKQLKRKEQECEELKQRLHQCWTVENSFVEQIDQLEAENKELKDSLANDECFVKGSKKCVKAFCLDEGLRKQLEQEKTLKEMYFTYYKAKHSDIKGEFFKLKAENGKLKQTLTEIKEIVRWHTTNADSEDIQIDMKQILQLISEVQL